MPKGTERGGAALIEAEKLARWSADLGEMLGCIDDDVLPQKMDDALNRLAPFDLSVTFAYPAQRSPLLLFDGFRGAHPGEPLSAYLGGAYLLDPFAIACLGGVSPGLYRMQQLAPDKFFEGEYFNSWQVHPCISMQSGTLAEEIGYLFPLGVDVMAAYSLMRSHDGRPFDAREFAVLRAIEPVVRQTLTMHWRRSRRVRAQLQGPEARSLLEDAFQTFASEGLTPQQRRIVQMILRGHSNASIGGQLGISEGTAKNHRHAIYDRLKISSQSELFTLFIRHLSSHGRT
jgi:DNA-binding CsgD family transcriptional regulator